MTDRLAAERRKMEVNTQFTGSYYASMSFHSKESTQSTFSFSANMGIKDRTEFSDTDVKAELYETNVEELYYRQTSVASADKIPQATNIEVQTKPLGIGFVFANGFGYGMSASQIINSDSEDVIVRVKVATGNNNYEIHEVNVSKVDPRNASAVEMFAFCQYADANGTGVDNKWGSWHAMKSFSVGAGDVLEYDSLEDISGKKTDWTKVLSKAEHSFKNDASGETLSVYDVFKMLKDTLIEEHTLTPENIEKEDDWRKMDASEWDKLIKQIDNYIEAFKDEQEKLEELQKKAAMEGAMNADASMKATAASSAALSAAANGMIGDVSDSEDSFLERSSWTYEMETDDQAILAKAKKANEFAADMKAKVEEMAADESIEPGIGSIDEVPTTTSLEENDGKRTWTITCFGEDGIICNQCVDGKTTELWRMNYKNPDDYKIVWDFINSFDKDADLKFASSRQFWEDFIDGKISDSEIERMHEEYRKETI